MLPKPLTQLIKELQMLPGVGERQATRFALALLAKDLKTINNLARTLRDLKIRVGVCQECFNLALREPGRRTLCRICRDERRTPMSIAVVQNIQDLAAIEQVGVFRGRYHVIWGALSPSSSKQSKRYIDKLTARIKGLRKKSAGRQSIEVILALNPTREGELAASYLAERLKSLEVKVSRIGRGIPTGGELEYADDTTIAESFKRRTRL